MYNLFNVANTEDNEMIKAGIIGATGYAGNEIARLLLGHKEVEVAWYGSRSYIDKKYAGIYQNFFKLVDAKCMDDNMEALADEVDVIFTATPQGLCASLVNEGILSRAKVIDLSADFRIKDVKKYEKWYGIEHKSPQFIDEAVYGLCEINREDIKKARLIANPGCYPTCSGIVQSGSPAYLMPSDSACNRATSTSDLRIASSPTTQITSSTTLLSSIFPESALLFSTTDVESVSFANVLRLFFVALALIPTIIKSAINAQLVLYPIFIYSSLYI